jgi:hypothetical protein
MMEKTIEQALTAALSRSNFPQSSRAGARCHDSK